VHLVTPSLPAPTPTDPAAPPPTMRPPAGPLAWPLRVLWSLLFALLTATMVLVGGVAQVLALPWDRGRRVAAWAYRLFWGRLLWLLHPSLSPTLVGAERLGPGPYIVVSNHQSSLDIPAGFMLPLPLRVVVRHQHFDIPGVGGWLRLSRQVRLDREDPQGIRKGLDDALASLDAGFSLLIFPEGTRTPEGSLGRFHRGAFRLAKDAGVPVLPFVQQGTAWLFPKGVYLPRCLHQPMRFSVLPPVDPADFGTARAMARAVEDAMRAVIEGPAADREGGGPL